MAVTGKAAVFFSLTVVSEQLLFNSQIEDSTDGDIFSLPINGTEHVSPPWPQTNRDRELFLEFEAGVSKCETS